MRQATLSNIIVSKCTFCLYKCDTFSLILFIFTFYLFYLRKPKALNFFYLFRNVNDSVLLYTYFNHFLIPSWNTVLPGRFLFDVPLYTKTKKSQKRE